MKITVLNIDKDGNQVSEEIEVPDNWFDAPCIPMTTEEALADAVADLMYRMDLQTLGLTEV